MRSGSPPGKKRRSETTPEADSSAVDRIFISYRREETAYAAGWLFDRLAERFGADQIFKDVDSIELGDDFVAEINRAVGSTDVLLALIGDRWLTVADDNGVRRLDHGDDFVRVEIEAAIARDVRIIPILVDGATMPRSDELPRSLTPLARRQALELSPSRFESDTSRLLTVLERTLAERRMPSEDDPPVPPGAEQELQDPTPRPTETGAGSTGSDEISSSSGGWRESVASHWRLLGGIAVAIVVASAIAVFANRSNNGTTAPHADGNGAPTQVASFVDDFSSERYGWESVNPDELGGRYEDGTYRLTAERTDSADGYSTYTASPNSQASSSDLRIAVHARMVEGAAYARAYGLYCRGDGAQDLYAFTVWKNGAEIGKFTNGSYERLSPPDASVSSQPGEAPKRLEAICSTTTENGRPVVALEFWVDDARIAATDSTEDGSDATPLASGRYGLQATFGPQAPAGAKIDVEFDDFEVGPP
jgi:hypothetical protein